MSVPTALFHAEPRPISAAPLHRSGFLNSRYTTGQNYFHPCRTVYESPPTLAFAGPDAGTRMKALVVDESPTRSTTLPTREGFDRTTPTPISIRDRQTRSRIQGSPAPSSRGERP